MEDEVIGRGMIGDGCEGVHIVNNLNVPILAMGLRDTVIAAGPDGILISSQAAADRIKPYVEKLSQQIMFAEKSWGRYQVLDVQEKSMTILATLNPGQHMSYHSHEHRDEVWTVIRGSGKSIVDGMEQQIRTGDVITMEAGSRHTVIAGEKGLQLIEVQIGEEISAADKHKYEL